VTAFLVRRILQMVPVLIGTTFLIFAAVYALPGDPIAALAGPTRVIPESVEAALREEHHLNDPLLVQYWHYLSGLLTGDFGTDMDGYKVSDIIAASWPVTVRLALTTWVIESVLGIVFGTLAAIRQGKAIDVGLLATTTLILGVPYFVIAYVAQIVVGVEAGLLPASGIDDGWPASYILPSLVLAMLGLPSVLRLTRSSVLDNLYADHIDTATAKGMPRGLIVRRHVLRTSLEPVVSLLGVSLGNLLGGAILVEGIFNLPGIGHEVWLALQIKEGPTLVGIVTFLVLIYLFANLVVDLLYGVLDPRIRYD
jgi:oligopeptide transport system permease protein